MYCKHCGNQIDDNAQFCSGCGKSTKNDVANTQTNIQSNWILIFISIGLLLLSLILALNIGTDSEVTDIIFPAILSLGSLGLSGYVFAATKINPDDKTKHKISLLALIGGVIMSVELCFGALIGIIVG